LFDAALDIRADPLDDLPAPFDFEADFFEVALPFDDFDVVLFIAICELLEQMKNTLCQHTCHSPQ
jgi:hypothetical protein